MSLPQLGSQVLYQIAKVWYITLCLHFSDCVNTVARLISLPASALGTEPGPFVLTIRFHLE